MRFTILINQIKAIEWGLNSQEALLFSFCYELHSWAESITIDNKTYYWYSKQKIIDELPILTNKPDTAYRLLNKLKKAGLIETISISNKNYLCITNKGKDWNSEDRKKIRPLEKYPKEVGKNSAEGSEKNPTDNIIKDNTTNISFADSEKSAGKTITHELRLIFEEYYRKEKDEEYYYDAASGSNLTKIISKIKFLIKHKNGEKYVPKEEEVKESWILILTNLKKYDNWVYDNLSIQNINSKFNELIAKIKQGLMQQHNGTKTDKRNNKSRQGATVDDIKEVLSRHFDD